MTDTDFQIFHIRTDDDLTLYGRDYGHDNTGRLPLVCLSGLSRNSRDFHPLALRLVGEGRRVITLDYRGRGLSGWDSDKDNYNIVREAKDVVLALDLLSIGRAAFIGTSRGGLILHILGTMIADRIAAIVFNDIGPVIERDGLKRIRDYLSARPALSSFGDAARHLKTVHCEEFTVLDDSDWLEMAEALYREIDSRLVADFDPALIEPLKKMDFSTPIPDLWAQFEMLKDIPILVVRGANSTLLSESTVSQMIARHENAQTIAADGQGHAPLLHIGNVCETLKIFINAH